MHITDLNKRHQVQIAPSTVRLYDYSKTIIPTNSQATLHCTHRRKSYRLKVKVITAQRYYSPLLGLADNLHMAFLSYDADTANNLESATAAAQLLFGKLTLPVIKHAYPHLFDGLGELGAPFSLTLNPTIKPIQAATSVTQLQNYLS